MFLGTKNPEVCHILPFAVNSSGRNHFTLRGEYILLIGRLIGTDLEYDLHEHTSSMIGGARHISDYSA